MYVIYCAECDERMLVGNRATKRVHNLGHGSIVVELACYAGHRIYVMTGRATAGGKTPG